MSKKIDYEGMKNFIINSITNGKKSKDIYIASKKKFGYDKKLKSFQRFCQRIIKELKEKKSFNNTKQISSHRSIKSTKKSSSDYNIEDHITKTIKKVKQISLYNLCNDIDCSPRTIETVINKMRKCGTEVIIRDNIVIFGDKKVIPGDFTKINKPIEQNEIIFGIVSDPHFGSKHCQITRLNEFCEICKKEGVKYIFSPGDILSGTRVYPGHEYDVYALTSDEQEQSCIVNLPKGFEWYVIGGNHDYTFVKKGGGHNPLKVIEDKRSDFHYCGFDSVVIPILENVELMMGHPSGGLPYSSSYRLQKTIEQVAYSELADVANNIKNTPTIRFCLLGHLHIQLQAMFGSIMGIQCGTFEGRTSYLVRKNLVPHIGGYIIKATLNKNGQLKRFSAEFLMYTEIQDDYKNYNHIIKNNQNQIIFNKPIFK